MKACNRKILELFYNAKHTGRIIKPDAVGRVGEDDDGLVIELTWRVINGVIEDAKFRAFGNPNAIAITSLMTDNMIGKSIEDVMLIGEEVIIDNLDELRPEYVEAFDMVRMAMAEAYNNYTKRQNRQDSYNVEYSRVEVNVEEDNEFDITQQTEIKSLYINSERRGRGRPRKERTPEELVAMELAQSEKRGRGRPRKEYTPEELEAMELASKEKRGRGRPRKERTPEELEAMELASKEKRGRGRPRKIVDESIIVEIGEKRGRGRPKKEVKFDLPKSDLDEVIKDEEVDQLINGNSKEETNKFVDDLISNKLTEQEDDVFDADYDLFKSSIRNIFAGNEIEDSNKQLLVEEKEEQVVVKNIEQPTKILVDNINNIDSQENETINEYKLNTNNINEIVEEKRGRGRPRKERTPEELEAIELAQVEKRGRGRPKKIVIETVEEPEEKRGRGRPRLNTVNSLTRSLTTPGGVPTYNNTQDIVFASKNVTTTNININVTKTTTNVDDDNINNYSKNINISSTQHSSTISAPASAIENQDEEIEIEPVAKESETKSTNFSYDYNTEDKDDNYNNAEVDYEDDMQDKYYKVDTDDVDYDEDEMDEEIDDSHIKDEAPKGGIEDLLKALLDD